MIMKQVRTAEYESNRTLLDDLRVRRLPSAAQWKMMKRKSKSKIRKLMKGDTIDMLMSDIWVGGESRHNRRRWDLIHRAMEVWRAACPGEASELRSEVRAAADWRLDSAVGLRLRVTNWGRQLLTTRESRARLPYRL